MAGAIELPRKNGELVFETPWEARVFGIAVALNESGAYAWQDFSAGLAAEIARAEEAGAGSSYYERWMQALEKLAVEKGLVSPGELEARAAECALHEDHDHHHGGG